MRFSPSKLMTRYAYFIGIAVVFLIAIFFAHKNYFIQDDAYIAFVYARNFAEGHGLVWYPGSTEYGYTNFLYTLIVGIIMYAGIHPEYISAIINFSAYILALWLVFQLTCKLSNSRFAGFCAALVLATHHTFSAYASGGLETMVATALVLGFYTSLVFSYADKSPIRTWHIALLSSAALLTRLDSSLLLFPGYVWIALQSGLLRTPRQCLTQKSLWIMAGIPTLAVFALLTWAYSYYGYALPNTFYAKIPDGESMAWLGTRYISKYLSLHEYIPAYLAGFSGLGMAWLVLRKQWQILIPLLYLAATIVLWLSYVIYIGGGFMEFRLLVPLLPLFMAAVFVSFSVVVFAQRILLSTLLISAIALTLITGNFLHAKSFTVNKPYIEFMDPHIGSIDAFYKYANIELVNWRIIGKALKKLLYTGNTNDIKLAIFPAGMIPYYSSLHSVDVHGLNDRKILLNKKFRRKSLKKVHTPNPGHMFIANDYLLDFEKINLNIYHPQTFCKNRNGSYNLTHNIHFRIPFQLKRLILIPINSTCYLIADYRTPHPLIDKLLAKGIILDYRKNRHKIHCPRWLCNDQKPRKIKK